MEVTKVRAQRSGKNANRSIENPIPGEQWTVKPYPFRSREDRTETTVPEGLTHRD